MTSRLAEGSDNPRRQYFDKEMSEVIDAYKKIMMSKTNDQEKDDR